MIRREQLLDAIAACFVPEPWALALWEAGSAAWGRVDAWSDVDLELVVEEGHSARAFATLDAALAMLSKIELRWEAPALPGLVYRQLFYRLEGAGEFLLVDFVAHERAHASQLGERERHGARCVLFDKCGISAQPPLDRDAHAKRLRERLASLRLTFPLFQSLVKKELARGRAIDAHAFYVSHTLSPLITLLRMRHCPERFDFGARYLEFDLPRALADEVRTLWYVATPEDLARKHARAIALFAATLAELDAALPSDT